MNDQALSVPFPASSGLPAHKLQRVYALVDSHLGEAMHVRVLAQAVNLSPFHFARMFKKSTGRSPHAYITHRRMERARQLLCDEELSILEVGTLCGYQTQAHFTDVFRKHVGVTPGRYRRLRVDERLAAAALAVPAIDVAAVATAVRPEPRELAQPGGE